MSCPSERSFWKQASPPTRRSSGGSGVLSRGGTSSPRMKQDRQTRETKEPHCAGTLSSHRSRPNSPGTFQQKAPAKSPQRFRQ